MMMFERSLLMSLHQQSVVSSQIYYQYNLLILGGLQDLNFEFCVAYCNLSYQTSDLTLGYPVKRQYRNRILVQFRYISMQAPQAPPHPPPPPPFWMVKEILSFVSHIVFHPFQCCVQLQILKGRGMKNISESKKKMIDVIITISVNCIL